MPLTWSYALEIARRPQSSEPVWLVDQCLVPGSKLLIGAQIKSMKSTMALDLAWSIASGENFLGQFAVRNPGAVVYLNSEIDEDVTMREWLRRLIAARSGKDYVQGTSPVAEEVPLLISTEPSCNLLDSTWRTKFVQTLKEIDKDKLRLVIVDPLYSVIGNKNISSQSEMYPLLSFLSQIRDEFNCAVALVHHQSKPVRETSSNFVPKSYLSNAVSGSYIFGAWWESYWSLERSNDAKSEVTWRLHFRAKPSPDPAIVTWEMETETEEMREYNLIPIYKTRVEKKQEETNQNKQQQQEQQLQQTQTLDTGEEQDYEDLETDTNLVLQHIERLCKEGERVRITELKDNMHWRNQRFYAALNKLEEEGLISKEKDGRETWAIRKSYLIWDLRGWQDE